MTWLKLSSALAEAEAMLDANEFVDNGLRRFLTILKSVPGGQDELERRATFVARSAGKGSEYAAAHAKAVAALKERVKAYFASRQNRTSATKSRTKGERQSNVRKKNIPRWAVSSLESLANTPLLVNGPKKEMAAWNGKAHYEQRAMLKSLRDSIAGVLSLPKGTIHPASDAVESWLYIIDGILDEAYDLNADGCWLLHNLLVQGRDSIAAAILKSSSLRPEWRGDIIKAAAGLVEYLSPPKRRKANYKRAVKPRKLTGKQRAAVEIVAENKGNIAAAARAMGKDPSTIRQHFKAGMAKLGEQATKRSMQSLRHDRRGQADIIGADGRGEQETVDRRLDAER